MGDLLTNRQPAEGSGSSSSFRPYVDEEWIDGERAA
jgi:hypothetical protein